MRQPSLDASVVVDVENNAILAEFHMGIGMEPSFKMDLQCQEEINLHINKMYNPISYEGVCTSWKGFLNTIVNLNLRVILLIFAF